MKRMILVVEIEAAEEEEVDLDEVENLLEQRGFVSSVESDEGGLTLLPPDTYYGEFEDEVTASSLADLVEEAVTGAGYEVLSLLITEMGADQVLIGEEAEPGGDA